MAGLLDKVLDMSLAARMARAKKLGITLYKNAKGEVIPPTQYEIAHAVAQRNASLPVEQGGLGLPANNTAADRARAMGFDQPGFRGSSAVETEHPRPIWWTQDPEYASAYTWFRTDPGNVMPLQVKLGNSRRYDKLEIGFRPNEYEFRVGENGVDTGLRRYGPAASRWGLHGKVYEGLTVPQNVRSRFAAFDPAKASSSDLLAGLGPYAAAGGLGLLALGAPGESRAAKLSSEMTHTQPSQPVDRLGRLQAGMQAGAATNVPIASDVMGLLGDALMYYREPESRTWPNYMGTALGMLPFIP